MKSSGLGGYCPIHEITHSHDNCTNTNYYTIVCLTETMLLTKLSLNGPYHKFLNSVGIPYLSTSRLFITLLMIFTLADCERLIRISEEPFWSSRNRNFSQVTEIIAQVTCRHQPKCITVLPTLGAMCTICGE